jgi:hypothetical protein
MTSDPRRAVLTLPEPTRAAPVIWIGLALFYTALTCVYAHPLIGAFSGALAHDLGDPALNAWIIWWNAHAIPLTARWWNAPIFFPATGSFALSETLLGIAPLTTPLQWAGASAVVAYNTAFLLSFPAAALAAHALAHRLTGRHDAALLAGLAFGFSPYRAAQLTHLQMLWSCWMPWCLLALHRYVDRGRVRHLAAAGVCWLLNGLTSGYFLLYFAVLAALWVAWFARRWRQWTGIGVALAAATLAIAPVIIGYARHQAALGLARDTAEIGGFSADLTAMWAAASAAWLPAHWTLSPQPEGELYPGIVVLLLTCAGAVAAWRQTRVGRRTILTRLVAAAAVVIGTAGMAGAAMGVRHFQMFGVRVSITRLPAAAAAAWCVALAVLIADPAIRAAWRRRSALLFYAAGAVVMLLFALGPVPHLLGAPFLPEGPYAWLMRLPGGHALRVPARFGILSILCLSQTAALAFARMIPRGARLPVTTAAIAIALEGWVFAFPMAAVPPLESISPALDPGAAVLEVPMRDVYADTTAMLRATVHRHPVVNGFSGYRPPHYDPLREGLLAGDASTVAALRQFGELIVQVTRTGDPEGNHAAFIAGIPGAEPLFRSPIGPVFRLPALPPSAPPNPGQALPIAAVRVTTNGLAAGAMIDGRLDTAWQSVTSQQPQEQVVLTFAAPVRLSQIELDLGSAILDYPRQLRVAIADDEAHPATVWEGDTSGAAVLGILSDRVRAPVVINLPGSPSARQFSLTLAERAAAHRWTIAEIRAYGTLLSVPGQ